MRRAQRLLDELHAASLVDESRYRRYTLHDLVATYARDLARQEPEPERHAAAERLFGYYASITSDAMDLVYPLEPGQRSRTPSPTTPKPPLDEGSQAQAWLDNELDNLLAVAHHAPEQGRPDHIIHQSTLLRRHLRIRGHYNTAYTLHTQALRHARNNGDRSGEHHALLGMAEVHLWQNRYEQAAACYQQALAIAAKSGDRHGEHAALHGFGHTRLWQNRFDEAAEHLEQALAIALETGNRVGEQETLARLADMHRYQGRYKQAADYYQQVVALLL